MKIITISRSAFKELFNAFNKTFPELVMRYDRKAVYQYIDIGNVRIQYEPER